LEAIEKAIRNAFERGNPEDRAYRVKVYRSAFAALERAIASSGDSRSEAAEARRKALKLRIVELEAEFLPSEDASPRVPSTPVGAPPVEPDLRHEAGGEIPAPSFDDAGPVGEPTGFEPRLEPDDYRQSPASPDPAGPSLQVAPRGERRRKRRRTGRSLLTALLVGVLVLAAIGAGLWWVGNTGLQLISGGPETAADSPPQTLQEENLQQQDAAPSTIGSAARDQKWITIFTPVDPTTVTTPEAGTAEVLEEEGGKLLRIRSASAGSEFAFDVGVGVLERLAGKHAVFDVIAHSEEGKETQMSVNCDLGPLGQCGRKRYQVGRDRNDFLFEMDLPGKKPSAAGRITIDPDLSGKGNPLDIIEIRVSTSG
jgi:hypothetical protein